MRKGEKIIVIYVALKSREEKSVAIYIGVFKRRQLRIKNSPKSLSTLFFPGFD